MTKLLLISFILISPFLDQKLKAQNQDIQEILSQREASTQALRAFDADLNATYSTEDAFITSGLGVLISGKEEQEIYLKSLKGPRMYWIRTPDEVIVNHKTQLAWETGTWKGYYEDSEQAVVGGKYAAQWTKASGTWLIRSQLFVTLE
jgi:ketosteroid isomerase-like protein